jgi:hypothetical protein
MALGTCGILLPTLAVEMILSYAEGLRTIEREQSIRADAAASQVASEILAIESQVREVADLPWGRHGLGDSDRRAEFRRLLKRVPAILEITRYDASGRETLHVSRVTEDRIADPSAPPLADVDRIRRARSASARCSSATRSSPSFRARCAKARSATADGSPR